MGFKVNVFIVSCLLFGVLIKSFNLAFLSIILSVFCAVYKNFKVWKFTNRFPGQNFSSNWKTFFGNSSENFYQELNEMWVKLGRDKFVTWVGFERFITVSKLSDVQAVLSITEDALLMENHQQMWPWLGGDDVIKGSDFSSKALTDALIDGPFHKLLQSVAFLKSLNARMEAMCRQSFAGSDAIDIQPVIRSMTFDIIYELAMGEELKSQRRELLEAAENLCQMADQRVYSGWKQNKWLLNVLGEESRVAIYRNVLTQRVKKVLNEKRDESARRQSCLLDVLVANESLSQEEIVSTLVGFIVLGYDRLASSTCFTLVELSKSSEDQEIINRDVLKTSPGATSPMTSLENFLLETQRLHPATSIIKKWITEGVPLNGFFIPPNSSVFLYMNGTSRDMQRFERPDVFDSRRKNLSDTFGGKRHEANLPMTLMKFLLGNVVKNYQLRMEKGSVDIGIGITLRPRGVRVYIKAR